VLVRAGEPQAEHCRAGLITSRLSGLPCSVQHRRPAVLDSRLIFNDNEDKALMAIQLKPEQEHRIAEALRSGAYSSSDDVIDSALEVLHERDEWLMANQQQIDAKIRTGIDEIERGEGIPEDELDAYLQRLKAQPE
jgi:Arc/MetJ-type ribon-helix-helix transcriptional regulator